MTDKTELQQEDISRKPYPPLAFLTKMPLNQANGTFAAETDWTIVLYTIQAWLWRSHTAQSPPVSFCNHAFYCFHWLYEYITFPYQQRPPSLNRQDCWLLTQKVSITVMQKHATTNYDFTVKIVHYISSDYFSADWTTWLFYTHFSFKIEQVNQLML